MKQIKLLGVLAIALTLGLAACNGGGASSGAKSSGTPSSSKHVHTFDTSKWEADDDYHWHPATCEHTNQKGDRAAHTFGEPYDVVAATCEAAGSQKVKCSVCQKEVTQVLEALGHQWVDDEAGSVAPTCTEAGSKNQTCSRCGAKQEGVVVEALGHDYGEWTTVEGKAPTCTEAGQEQRVCSRCGDVDTQEVPALGHDFQLVGDDTEPEAGKAKVRVYTCQNGCGQTNLGFKANEVSDESKARLVINDDGGARFWGRPIGNAVPLNDSGDPDRDNHPSIFDKKETGDYFEYVFDLTKEQADSLANCRCFCDAKPADYLGRNGIDFWANTEGSEDWTRGRYIDDDPAHLEVDSEGNPVMVDVLDAEGNPTGEQVQQGKEITDYRYVLYVDGQIQEFDGTACPVPSSEPRAEYEMPFTFHLHEGENKISLRMAGGYRSVFYNFIFRAVEAPAA